MTTKRTAKSTRPPLLDAVEKDADLSDLLDAAASNAVVKIYREEEDGEFAFVAQRSPAQATETHLAAFGGGTYRLRIFGPHPDNPRVKKQLAQLTLRMAGSATPETPEVESRPAASVADQVMTAGLMQMLQQMQQGGQAQAQMMATMMQTQTAALAALGDARRDPTAGLLEKLLPVLLARGAGDDPLALLEKAASILGARGGPAMDPIDQLLKLDELREVLSKKAGDGGTHWAAPLLGEAVQVLKHAREEDGTMQQQQQKNVTGAPTAATPRAIPPGPLAMFGRMVPFLEKDAEAAMDPALSAEYHLSRLPEWALSIVRGALADQDATAHVVGAYPELQPHAAWVALFLDAVREQLAGGESEGGVDDGQGADDGAGVGGK